MNTLIHYIIFNILPKRKVQHDESLSLATKIGRRLQRLKSSNLGLVARIVNLCLARIMAQRHDGLALIFALRHDGLARISAQRHYGLAWIFAKRHDELAQILERWLGSQLRGTMAWHKSQLRSIMVQLGFARSLLGFLSISLRRTDQCDLIGENIKIL